MTDLRVFRKKATEELNRHNPEDSTFIWGKLRPGYLPPRPPKTPSSAGYVGIEGSEVKASPPTISPSKTPDKIPSVDNYVRLVQLAVARREASKSPANRQPKFECASTPKPVLYQTPAEYNRIKLDLETFEAIPVPTSGHERALTPKPVLRQTPSAESSTIKLHPVIFEPIEPTPNSKP